MDGGLDAPVASGPHNHEVRWWATLGRTTRHRARSAGSPVMVPMSRVRTPQWERHDPKWDPQFAMPLRHNPAAQNERNFLAWHRTGVLRKLPSRQDRIAG